MRAFPRLGFLDGLRGIAILLVVVFHLWQISWLDPKRVAPWVDVEFVARAGYLGVELFFFLSGFCLFWPLAGDRPWPTWREFYVRRALKILPSYLLVLAVAWWLSPGERPTEAVAWNYAVHLGFVHNFWSQSLYAIHGVLWSLAVEVQFYALFPLVAWGMRRAPWITGALLVAVAVWWRWMPLSGDPGAMTPMLSLLPAALDLFAVGMLAALVVARARRFPWPGAALLVLGLVGFVALVKFAAAADSPGRWQAVWRLPLALDFAAIAVGASWAPRGLQWVLDNPPLRFVGAISYNLYLWHKLIALALLGRRIPGYTGDPHDDRDWQWRFAWLVFGLALAVAAGLTYGVERPILAWRKRRAAPARTPGAPE